MHLGHEIRLPLQSGASEADHRAVALNAILPGLALVALGLAYVLEWTGPWTPRDLHDFPLLGWVINGGYPIVLGAALVRTAVASGRRWGKRAPSDVTLGPHGVSFLLDGQWRTISWAELDHEGCTVEQAYEKQPVLRYVWLSIIAGWGGSQHPVGIARLRLRRSSGSVHQVATSDDLVEMESFDAVLATVAAMDPDAEVEDDAATAQGSGLYCPACGAAVAPVDRPSTTCAFCEGDVPVSRELRARLQAAAHLEAGREALEEALRRLLRQPPAGVSRRWLTLGVVAMVAAWPLSVVAWLLHDTPRANDWLWLLGPLAMAAMVHALWRFHLARRRAIHIVARQGARPPEGPGQPHRCWACGAPLPHREDAALVSCVFCSTDNVTAVDLSRKARAGATQELSVEEALHKSRSERRGWFVRAVAAAVVLVALVVGGAYVPPKSGHERWQEMLQRPEARGWLKMEAADAGSPSLREVTDEP